MVAFVFFDEFKAQLANEEHDLGSDTFTVALSNTAPTAATDDALADITQISAGNGYSAGGSNLASVTWAETAGGSGIWRFSSADLVFTASGGSIGPFRYVILYNNTPTTPTADPLVGYLDYGSSITVTDTNTFTVDVGANGWFELDG
jgi:hypothetical protein